MTAPDPATAAARDALWDRYGVVVRMWADVREAAETVTNAVRPVIEAEATARERQRIVGDGTYGNAYQAGRSDGIDAERERIIAGVERLGLTLSLPESLRRLLCDADLLDGAS